jgi:hypothetical protein
MYIFSFLFLNESKSNAIVSMNQLYRKNSQNPPVASQKSKYGGISELSLNQGQPKHFRDCKAFTYFLHILDE